MNDLLRQILALPEQASTIALRIDELHYFVILVTMIGWALVTLAATVFLIRFQRTKAHRKSRRVDASLPFEIAVIGGLLFFFVLWWVIGYRQYVEIQIPPKDSMEVYVTAKQWMWQFAYPDGRSSIGVLTVPQNRPVKLLMTSRDVIHSFSVPDFRIKQDIVPGRYTTAWFEATRTGTHQILCAEYCGLGHSRMWGEVVVLSAADYERWLGEEVPVGAAPEPPPASIRAGVAVAAPGLRLRRLVAPPPAKGMAVTGRDIAVRYGCLGCHTVDGRRHIGPSWLGLFGSVRRLEGGAEVRADEAYLTESMMDPRAKVVLGYEPLMPTYQGILQAPEAAALLEFMKSLAAAGAESVSVPPPPSERIRTPTEFMKKPSVPERNVPPFAPPGGEGSPP